MASTTQSMTVNIEGMARRQPSQRALATRSLAAANRLTGDARRDAIREHFERFVSSPKRPCSVRR